MAQDDPSRAATAAAALSSELKMRIASGLVLAVIAFVAVCAGGLWFGLLITIVGLAVSWEWSRIVRGGSEDAALAAHLAAVAAAAVLSYMGHGLYALLAIAGGTAVVGALAKDNHPLLSSAGVGYAGLPVIVLLALRQDETNGLMAVLWVLSAVVATDTAAFAVGRTFGGPKLAPRISPNKTWSGFLGGVTAAAMVSAVLAHSIGASPLRLAAMGALLGAISQVGDLAESSLKRAFGRKDASNLIPGHGGFMDRADGIVFAAIAAGVLAVLINPKAPAAALLFGT
jgi:phosphatidate cytidylyltransferase